MKQSQAVEAGLVERALNRTLHAKLLPDIVQEIFAYSKPDCDFEFQINFHPNFIWYFGQGLVHQHSLDFRTFIAKRITAEMAFKSNLDIKVGPLGTTAAPTKVIVDGVESYKRMSPLENLLHSEQS